MGDKLTQEKKLITENHLKKMVEAHEIMAKMIDKAMTENQTRGGGDVGILEKLKAMVYIDRTKSIKIPAEDMLKYSEMWFNLTKQNFDVIMAISKDEYSSLLKGIDAQLESIRQIIKDINQELIGVDNEEKRKFLAEQQDKWIVKEW
jgi:hypothetical protein